MRLRSSTRSSPSTMTELDKTENAIRDCYYRLEVLEKNLKYRPMTIEEREDAEKDMEALRNILKKHELELKTLRKETPSSIRIAAVLVIATFLVFGIYHMMTTGVAEQSKDPITLTF